MAKSASSVETHSCAIGGERQGQTANIHIARPARDFDQAVRPLWAARQSAHLEWNGGYAERVAQNCAVQPGSGIRLFLIAQRLKAADEILEPEMIVAHLLSAHFKMRTKTKKKMAGLMVLFCQPQAADIAEPATFSRPSGKSLRRFQPRG